MAIENSIAGSILPNYSLLTKGKVQIVGEVYLPIKQQLLVNPGCCLDDIKEVHSHQMALLQCNTFLEKYHWKLVTTEDTALSAKYIHQHKSKHIAAIASALAAKLYHLDIIEANIHTQKKNYTRFLILKAKSKNFWQENANKASIQFRTYHTKGSLSFVLKDIAKEGINLSSIQSMPIPGTDFLYSFYADLEFSTQAQFMKVIKKIKKHTQQLTIFGVYKNGK